MPVITCLGESRDGQVAKLVLAWFILAQILNINANVAGKELVPSVHTHFHIHSLGYLHTTGKNHLHQRQWFVGIRDATMRRSQAGYATNPMS